VLKRGPTHETDTLAVRAIISELPASWLVRSQDERDYGIDLSIEMFSGAEPTGKKLKTSDSEDSEVMSLELAFEAQLHMMQFVKKTFLDEDLSDQIAAEFSDPPY
jgi:hypothetical protein